MLSTSLSPALAAAGALALLLATPTVAAEARQTKPPEAHVTAPSANTYQAAAAMRDLWIGHIFWVRDVAVATLDKNTARAEAAEQQAIANARAIAAGIEPFYGTAAKNKFFTLLGGHYGAVKEYLVATAKEDVAAQAKATDALASNADAMATFLSTASPALKKDAVTGLLLAHGSHHIEEIQQLKARQYAAEAKTWDEMKDHVYVIADAVSDALAKRMAATR
jgi:hypothetical protein